MKKIYALVLSQLLVIATALAQVAVTVTNPTNTTPNLAASYTSFANAVTAVNSITAMSGPVTLTCAAGNETAPVGGFSIISPGGTSSTNTITFTASGTVTLTASASLTIGITTDAIIKLVGADYITINGFTMQENAANTTTGGAGPNNGVTGNNMTEWGVAFLHSVATNGCQNNTIQNNIIALNKSYANTFGIYSNVRHNNTAILSADDITNNTTAPHNNNKIYGNTISNVNFGIAFIGSATAAYQDSGNDIGGNSVATGNTISNWGGVNPTSGFVSNSISSYCIFVNHQVNENVSYNTITSAAASGTAVTFEGIRKDYSSAAPVGTITSNITYNTITMRCRKRISTLDTGQFCYR